MENEGADDTASKYNMYEVSQLHVVFRSENCGNASEGSHDPRPRALPAKVGINLAPDVFIFIPSSRILQTRLLFRRG